jgi:hypothetical protein
MIQKLLDVHPIKLSEVTLDRYNENLLLHAIDPPHFKHSELLLQPGNETTLEFLINNGCDVNATDKYGRTGQLIIINSVH